MYTLFYSSKETITNANSYLGSVPIGATTPLCHTHTETTDATTGVKTRQMESVLLTLVAMKTSGEILKVTVDVIETF